jgi:hypothetical protein
MEPPANAVVTKLASLTVRHRTKRERRNIATWLERLAKELRTRGDDYSPRFTAGYSEYRTP